MYQATYIISFDGVGVAEANHYAGELRNFLLDATPAIGVDQKRDDSRTQDFGGILVLVLGTSSVTAIVKALGSWLQLRSSASLTIETHDRKIIARNITAKDAARLSEPFLQKARRGSNDR
jgi:hypothetical protein